MDQVSHTSGDEDSLKPPLPRRSSPPGEQTWEIGAPKSKSGWHWIPKIGSKNRSSSRGSAETGNESPNRPSTPSAMTSHETELQIPPSPRPTASSSTSRIKGHFAKTMSRRPSSRREEKTSEPARMIEAREDQSVASRHNIGTASLDCEFYKIEYGQFKGRPACMIIIDVRLVYPPDNIIDRAKLEFRFTWDVEEKPSPDTEILFLNTQEPISKVFAPTDIDGLPTFVRKTSHQNFRPDIQGLSFKLGGGGGGTRTAAVNEHRWRVQGRREEHDGIYDTLGWQIYQNKASEDSVPRQLRLGMIAFHQHKPFLLHVNIEGSTRQKYRRPEPTRGKRWFNPPNEEDVGDHVLQKSMVEDLVSKQNLLIRDIAPSQRTEGPATVNLMDISGFGGGAAAAAGIETSGGVGVVTDLLSLGDSGMTADSPTTVMGSDPCT